MRLCGWFARGALSRSMAAFRCLVPKEAWNEVLEITVDAARTVTIERFGLPE